MKRFVLGFLAGAMLTMVTAAWTGYFQSAESLYRERGTICGPSYFLGYGAGVYNLMAGLYPMSSHRLGNIERETLREILAYPEFNDEPAAYAVIRSMINLGIITPEDALRALPEPWRKRLLR